MYRMLVVEDMDNIRAGIAYIVENMVENWTVAASAGDGASALASIRRDPVEFVLTDIKLPGMDGLELIKAIRCEFPRVLVGVLSGYADFDYAHTAMQHSVIDYVLKPTTPDKVRQVLKKAEEILDARQASIQVFTQEGNDEIATYERALFLSLQKRDRTIMDQTLRQISDSCKRSEGHTPDPEKLMRKLELILRLVFRDLTDSGARLEEEQIHVLLRGLPMVLDQNGYAQWLARFSAKLFEYTGMGLAKRHLVVEQVRERLKTGYAEPITLASIADEFYISANYLSELFKKEVGANFNDYLTNVRVKEAKKLLKSPRNYKIYEVAHLIGYPNERYFVKIFKKSTGYAPLAYRNQGGSENE